MKKWSTNSVNHKSGGERIRASGANEATSEQVIYTSITNENKNQASDDQDHQRYAPKWSIQKISKISKIQKTSIQNWTARMKKPASKWTEQASQMKQRTSNWYNQYRKRRREIEQRGYRRLRRISTRFICKNWAAWIKKRVGNWSKAPKQSKNREAWIKKRVGIGGFAISFFFTNPTGLKFLCFLKWKNATSQRKIRSALAVDFRT